jgi:hypothetical protein
MLKRIFLSVLSLTLLSGCFGSPAANPTAAPAQTAAAEVATEAALPTATLRPTSTSAAPTATADPAINTAVTQPASVYGPNNFPVDVNPLTGQVVANPALLARRPVAVKIQMFPRGERPPMGVSQADIVYDYYQNFGLTRFHAIFYGDNAQTVGPVRSARLLDEALVDMYKSIFAFGSAESRTYSKLFNSEFANRLVVEGNANCPPMCRVDPNATNLLVTNTDQLSTYVAQRGTDNSRQNLDGMTFNQQAPAGGAPGTQATIRFSISAYNRWDFDAASGRYLRSQDTQEASDPAQQAFAPLVDRNNGLQLAADNVVVVLSKFEFAFKTHPGPSEVVQIDLTGTGNAYAFRDGQIYQVKWNRPSKNSVLYLTFPDGSAYPYKPGNTWYEVIGETSKVSDLGNGAWFFHLAIP